ncbi:RNA-guided endonuclease InsQ/TnpB family protein [Vreelandella massiliensis]|uniref:RNA-guided endonuclease InsQ/TnpB family protein n=1 Tax=Vreelandella massiliensis TaxID=1816686 RepID=UPI00096A6235|nr:RNA-guided endonuclease TnpB family protein [Halomonas massiliensis]
MLTGIRYRAYPTPEQAQRLAQWVGCARVIYNGKCDDAFYQYRFAKAYLPAGHYPAHDKTYRQYKTELTPWLKDCPSQILRNSATIWHRSYQRFLKGLSRPPKRKSRATGNYIWLTQELFDIRKEGGVYRLFICEGKKKFDLGELKLGWYRNPPAKPKSIWIKVKNGIWTVSFSYEDPVTRNQPVPLELPEHIEWLKGASIEELYAMVDAIDIGVEVPIQSTRATFFFSEREKQKKKNRTKKIKRKQRKMARQALGSKQRVKTKRQIGRLKKKETDCREDFIQKSTHALANNCHVLAMEALKTKNMTRRAKAKQCPKTGKWLRNNRSAKAALNRSMLDISPGRIRTVLANKMYRHNKPLLLIPPEYTSQTCAACGHTHAESRLSRSEFKCKGCGHEAHADVNAAFVIKQHAIDLLLHSGTELLDNGSLRNPVLGAPGAFGQLATEIRRCWENPACASVDTSTKIGSDLLRSSVA